MSIFEYLESQALKEDHLDVNVEHLIEGFIPKKMISIWYADGGNGKSYLAHGVTKRLLDADYKVVYIDPDNPLSDLQERSIGKLLIGKHPKLSYLHRSSMTDDPLEILLKIEHDALGNIYNNVVFVIDGLKDVVIDLKNDIRMARVMKALMNIREAGATILVLHHTNKDGKAYQGSNQIRNSADAMYRLHKKPSQHGVINYFMEAQKDRGGVVDQGWRLDVDSLQLTPLDPLIAKMSSYEMELTSSVLDVLSRKNDISQKELLAGIGSSSDDKTARATLDRFDGVLYSSKKVGKSRLFSLTPRADTNDTNLTIESEAS